MRKILDAVVLPRDITQFETNYLKKMNKVALGFFALHLPIFPLVAWANDTGPLLALVLTAAVFAGPALACRTFKNPRHVSIMHGFSAMLMGGLLVHFGQGPVQIEMHFYFFVLLALLAVFGNPMAIVTAAATATVHHLALWIYLPSSVFNYDAPFWVVAVHAIFVVIESVAACFIARSFFDNVIGLEKIVQKRTAEVEKRNSDMRRVMDNVDQGFITIDKDGVMASEHSAIVDDWFGNIDEGMTYAQLVERVDSNNAAMFELGWDEVINGFMPLEVNIAQLPREIRLGEKTLHAEFTPITDEQGEVEQALVVVSDVTEKLQAERLEAEQRETMRIFDRLMRDKQGFLEFYEEATKMVDAISGDTCADMVELKRTLHTLKGNAAIFGIQTVSDICHNMESYVIDEGEKPTAKQTDELTRRWGRLRENLRSLLGERTDAKVEIEDEDFEALLRAVLEDRPRDELAQMLAQWKLEPTGKRLQHFGEQVQRIAQRLEKGEIEVACEGTDLRLDPKRWASFWSAFIHVVRNAVDHGIEDTGTRQDTGKSEPPKIAFETYIEHAEFVVAVEDNGRGIDWDSVTAKAREAGLPCTTREEIEDALFQAGVSTAKNVTSISGRGVGMAAVKSECEDRGGRIVVQSKPGHGTRFEFRFSSQSMAPDPADLIRIAA